jgi:hypothetical protein
MLVFIDNAKLQQAQILKHGGLTQGDGQFFSYRKVTVRNPKKSRSMIRQITAFIFS